MAFSDRMTVVKRFERSPVKDFGSENPSDTFTSDLFALLGDRETADIKIHIGDTRTPVSGPLSSVSASSSPAKSRFVFPPQDVPARKAGKGPYATLFAHRAILCARVASFRAQLADPSTDVLRVEVCAPVHPVSTCSAFVCLRL